MNNRARMCLLGAYLSRLVWLGCHWRLVRQCMGGQTPRGTQLGWVLGGLLILSASGCMSPAYLSHIAAGELRSLSRSRPIAQVLSRGLVAPDAARKLELVQEVRIYARDCVGLSVGRAYTYYEDNAEGPVAYAVSGAYRDRLEPYKWTYPVIGVYEARGFFDSSLADKEAQQLRSKGYDATVSEVSGFSTMGILPDPIRASNLQADDVDVAMLVLHELTHSTIFKASDTRFNESMATFVGRAAAQRFFNSRFGQASPEAAAADKRVADLKVIDSYVTDLHERLEALYCRPISGEEKISRREEVFAEHQRRFSDAYRPLLKDPERYESIVRVASDNATLIASYRYHNRSDLDLLARVQVALGGDLRAMIKLLRAAARQRDSLGYLLGWLAQRVPNAEPE
jgi:predicted aminopeptidase